MSKQKESYKNGYNTFVESNNAKVLHSEAKFRATNIWTIWLFWTKIVVVNFTTILQKRIVHIDWNEI